MTGPMTGQMMEMPLLVSELLTHAARHNGDTEIVTRRVEDGAIHRYTWRDCERRARQLAQALARLGVQAGDRVGTLAWNTYRHLEAYYGVSGSGAVVHTINPRLFCEQLTFIVNDAQDGVVMFDVTFAGIVDLLAPQCPSVRHWVAMTDRASMPEMKTPVECYEDLVQAESGDYAWPLLDERSACGLCYTSGTTGHPKGVLYSHRSNVLHALVSAGPNALGISSREVVLPVVPMFHVNAWGIPYSGAAAGAKMVLPGRALDGASVYELIESEKVTFTAGVPTVWLALLNYMEQAGVRFSTLKRTLVGGAALPPAMQDAFQQKYGVQAIHGWGMSETSPIVTVGNLTSGLAEQSASAQEAALRKQGRTLFGADIKIVDEHGNDLPWDGVAFGDLYARGHWVCERYFNHPDSALRDGWFPTGDVATIDPDGYMQITDRSKDVIKSGGEWISSIDVENIAVAFPGVAEAACIAAHHAKWAERPLLVIVRKPGATVTREELLKFYEGKVAKWWIPDEVVFVDEIPHTATGKILKFKLRERFADYLVQHAGASQ
ncbi:3-(methylthio)propionyl-CoA ligase [Pararobbsia alpina]|uniref:3-(methylthio)propionyl-CoA ligase n=1 Tax=Pararobbsia alpina TaxID=621374 RepID=UPI0039A50232